MPDLDRLRKFLDGSTVQEDVFGLRPDYRVMLLGVDGLVTRSTDEWSHELLQAAESAAVDLLQNQSVGQVPHVAAWRETYRAFGAKPQRTRNSLEALLRRAPSGLPRVNMLTDIYNAISVLHQIPVGGEDLNRYSGSPRLIRASGNEPFDTIADGAEIVEYPNPGEVVWCDDTGVTCRFWNWRQARRTQLADDTTAALFIFDALDPISNGALEAATGDLIKYLTLLNPDLHVASRLISR